VFIVASLYNNEKCHRAPGQKTVMSKTATFHKVIEVTVFFSYAKLYPPSCKRFAIEKFQPRLQMSRFKVINFSYILSQGRTLSTLVHGAAVDTFIV